MASECEAAAPLGGGGGRSRRNGLASAAAAIVLALAALLGVNAAVANTGVTFVVDDTRDMVDGSTDDGVCKSAAGMCTLRAAIQQTNALPGADTIVVPAGTYELEIPPLNQNLADNGDFDVTDSLAITGAGAGMTIVDGGTPKAGAPPRVHGLDRLFEVLADGGTVTFSGLTFSDGYADEYGGAVMNNSTATVTVAASALTGNVADKVGGAIDNHLGGAVYVQDSTLSNNFSFESGSALNNNRDGTLTVTNSTILSNSAADVALDESLAGAGAIANNADLDLRGTITVTGSQISDNAAGGSRVGAALSNDGAGTVTVDQTTFSKNRSQLNGGAIFNGAGDVTVTRSMFSENAGESGGAIFNSAKDGRLTVSDSTFSLNTADARGGAIANGGTGSVSVADSTFSKNSADGWGGAIVNDDKGSVAILNSAFRENSGLNGGGFGNEGDGLVTVDNSTFTKNSAFVTSVLASGEGGGMHTNSSGDVVITGGTFSENTARSGGGLGNEGGGQLIVTGTHFSANKAEEKGGGILIQSGTVRMLEIDVIGNFADGAIEAGGGIAYEGDKLASVGEAAAIENSRIRDNKAKGQGGGIDSRGDGPLDIASTSITGNTAGMGGGIHHVGDAPLDVTRSTLSGNFAENGGGLFTDGDGETGVENTTVSGNRAGQFGGGLLVSSRLNIRSSTVANNNAASGGGINKGGGDLVGDGTVFLRNTIVANSPAGGNCMGTMTSLGGNIDSGNTCQFRELSDQPGTDPRLGPLTDNGGPTHTHALLADSPAQEKAVCTAPDPCPPVDQRGIARPIFIGSDIGAYESELTPGGGAGNQPCTGRSERPVLSDFDSWISEGVPGANFGTDSILKVKSLPAANQRALVHFTLPVVPPGCKLVGAKLRLYSSSVTEDRTLEALRVTSDWSEFGVTWGNQPDTVEAAATTQSGREFREWDVLEQTRDMYAFGDHGFLIRDAAENESGEQSFHSTEKGIDRPPQLILVFDDPNAPPPPMECPTTPQSLAADADSWVSEASPSNNFGADSTLKVKSQLGSNARALVKFPLPALPHGCTSVASATLRLDASSAKVGRTLEAWQIASAWSENGVTWSNQPRTTGSAATIPSADGMVEWTVTDQVLGMYVSANHGFLIRDADENGVGDEQTLSGRVKLNDGAPELVLVFDDSTPETTIDSGPVSPTNATDATFAFFSDRDDATFECSLDGAAFEACESPLALEDLAEGGHTLEVRSTRKVRAVDPTPATYTWTLDVTAPVAEITERPPDPSNKSEAGLLFAGSDNVDAPEQLRFQCRRDGGVDFASCESPQLYELLAEGSHTFEVRALDRAGNVGAAAAYSWTVDQTAPDTAIGERPSDPSNSSSASFSLAGADNHSAAEALSFQCRLDSALEADWESCASPKDYRELAEGRHSVEVRALDEAGNVDQSPDSYAWTVDLTAPGATIASGPADPTNETAASFAFSGSDNHDELGQLRFQCRLDAADYGDCASPQNYELLPEGRHTFDVRALDRAGNVGAPASYTWRVDTVAPTAMIDARPPNASNNASPSFDFSTDEAATFECKLDLGDYAACESPHGLRELADGEHTFHVRATDVAGNVGAQASYTWTVDTVAPTAMINSRPPDPSNNASPTIDFSADEAATFECKLDLGDYAACETPHGLRELADGEHVFQVRATDVAGNVGAPASYTWTVDTVAPIATIEKSPPDPSNSASASFEFSVGESARFECKLDLGDWAACISPQGYGPLGDGEHAFQVRATDVAGNVGAPASSTWTVDTRPPDTSMNEAPQDPTNQTGAHFEFSADEASSFACSLDNDPYEACVSPYDYPVLEPGPHVFRVQASDEAGNVEAEPAEHAWTIDVSEPETLLGDRPPATTTSTSATFTFSSDAGATFECKLDTDAFTDCQSPKSYADFAVGGHRFEVRARDAAGNRDSSPATYEWTVEAPDTTPPDTNPPETTIVSGPAHPTNQTAANFSFAGTDDVSEPSSLRFECRLDTTAEAGWEVCSSPKSYSALADRTHTFEVRAIDVAGNVDSSPATDSWTIDTSAPETTIDSGPSGLTNDSTPTYAFSSEAGARFQCRVDGGSYAACTSPHTTAPLADGAHTFEVRALDAAGNVDANPASRAVTVDSAAPQTSIGDAPPATTSSTTATFTFSSEPAATFECSLDATPFATCTSPRQYTGLASGGHQFRVRATDAAGNTDASPATHSWTIDTTAPETTVGDKPPATTTSTSTTFTFSSSEAGSTFECSLDGAAFAACTSPKDYTGLAVGTHEFRVRAKDAAGNTDASPATHSWTIEAAGTCAGPSTVTAGANADTWVLESSSTSNYGSDSVVKVDTKAGANARALFRFTLPALPSGCRVTDAKLRLYASSYKSGRALEAVRLGANWTESGVRWSNQPATTGGAAAASSPSASTYVQWSVTSQVGSMYSGDNHGFLIRDGVENGSGIEQGFHSREKGTDNPPQLVITFG